MGLKRMAAHNLEQATNGRSTGAGASVMDIALVLLISGAAFALELRARETGLLALGDDTTGVFAVIAGALAALALVIGRGQSLRQIGFRRPKRWWTAPLWAVAILTAYIAAQIAVPQLVGLFVELPALDLSRYDNLYQNLPAVLMFAAIVPLTAAIPEEIIYRGFLMDRLTRIFGTGFVGIVLVVLVQGALFGAAHFQWGAGGMLLTTIMGIVWGTAFLLCGRNLWIVILAHTAGDLLLVGQLYFIKGSEMGAG